MRDNDEINGQLIKEPAQLGQQDAGLETSKAEERYRQLLDDTYDGYGVTQEGKIVFANRRFCEIFGYEPGQVTGKSLDQFTMPDDRQAVLQRYQEMMRGEKAAPEQHETVVMKSDGTAVTVDLNLKL
ncbi:PAS domain S-box protein, partial [Chloroflexota bacterium]